MSFARFSNKSDIYMYVSSDFNKVVCDYCLLLQHSSRQTDRVQMAVFSSFKEVYLHIQDHIKAGHSVEKYTIDLIKKEMKKEIKR